MTGDSRDEELQDNDPTDELPVLLETAVPDPNFVAEAVGTSAAGPAEDFADHTVRFSRVAEERGREELALLQRDLAERGTRLETLEAQVRRLSETMVELERQLAQRDADIARLERERDEAREAIGARHELAAALTEREAQLERVTAESGREREARAAAEAALAQYRERLASTEAALGRANGELEAARATLAAELAKPPPPPADARVRALQEELATLSSYIENRRARWADLEARLAAATARIGELERELEHRAQRQRAAEQLAQNESARADGLRRELIDASRALAERDAALAAARTSTSEPQRQIDELRSELEQAHALNTRFERELAAALEAAAVSTARPRADGADALEIVAQLEGELEHKRTQVTALSIEARTSAREADKARSDLAAARTALAEARAEIEQQRAEIGRLERALVERQRATDARNERLGALQRELEHKLGGLQRAGNGDVMLHEREVAALQADPPADTPALVCLTSEAPHHYALSKGMMTIGRSAQCDIQVFTQFVSREHARLTIDRSRVIIEDLGSTNGIFVNSVRVDRHELRHGDLLTVGETQFRFLERMAH